MTAVVTAAEPELAPPPPDAPRERVPLYVWAFLASLALNVFSGNSGLMGFPLPPDRLLLAGSLLLLALEPRRDRLRWLPLHGLMVALVLWTTWSALTAGTLTTTKGFYALLDRVAVPMVMLVVGPLVFSSTYRRDLLLRTLTLVGIYLGVVGVASMVGPSQLVQPRYILDFMHTADIAIDDPRAYGPFLSAEANGMAMALCGFAAALTWVRTRSVLWRLAALASVAGCVAGVLLSVTRSAWLGVILGGLAVALLVPVLRRWLVVAVVALVGLGGAVLLAVPSLLDLVTNRLTTSRSLYDRANTYEAGWRALTEAPLTGIGWSRFLEDGTEWVRQSPDYPITTVTIEIHNVFLSRAVETGVPGAALWVLVVLAGPVAVLWHRRRAQGEERMWWLFLLYALAVWFVPSMTSPNPYPFPNFVFWLVAGIVGRQLLVHVRTTHRDPDGIERRYVPEEA